jgi:hypothetical protein
VRHWTNSRSSDYNLSALEFDLSAQEEKSTGVLLPASQFKIDKRTKELMIENYQNPWKLVNVLNRSADWANQIRKQLSSRFSENFL